MLKIYAPHVIGSSVSFEWELPTVTEFKQRISETLKTYPWLVAEDDSGPVGYAYAASYRSRTAYQWSVETSVYIRHDQHRKGVGRKLYETLLPILKKQKFTTAFAVIALPNEKSTNFHEALGFKYFCTYPKVGFKLNAWHDVGWWSKELNSHEEINRNPTPFKEIFSIS